MARSAEGEGDRVGTPHLLPAAPITSPPTPTRLAPPAPAGEVSSRGAEKLT
jgi:hypothetical protein